MTATAVWPLGLPHDEARRIYQSQPFTVYRQYDAADVLLYIGVTDNLHRRNLAHKSVSPWWPLVARIESELLPNFREAWLQEFRLIKNEGPLYNVVHSRDREGALARRSALLGETGACLFDPADVDAYLTQKKAS